MKKVILLLFLPLVVFSLYAQNTKVHQINEYLDLLGKNNQDMGKVVIQQKGETFYSATFTPEGVTAYDSNSLKYRIGSISKFLTAILIFQLQEEGLINLDETINTYFPDVPNADRITIAQLLSHTSGLRNMVMKNDTIHTWLFKPVSQEEIIKEIIAQGVQFQPGENTLYSNSGYYLLACILEMKSGKNYPELLQERILSPLKLKNTIGSAPGSPDIALAYKFDYKDKKWKEADDFYFPNIKGVGDVASTPRDLAQIIEAGFAGKLVTKTSLEQMKPQPQQLFGKGLAFIPFNEKVFYGHSGGTFGAYAMIMHNETDQLTISMTINGQETIMNDVLINILNILYDRGFVMPQFPEQDDANFDPEELSLLEGIYGAESFPLQIKVFRQGEDIYMQGTGQPAFIVNRLAKNKFFRKDIKLEAEFSPEENSMKFTQMGQTWVLKKE